MYCIIFYLPINCLYIYRSEKTLLSVELMYNIRVIEDTDITGNFLTRKVFVLNNSAG